ncbi:cyclophilin-like domain-containing protein [Mycena galopus ATCC 62051]|nr:cyclophilin-like domain-containing protein [Mycena galopus ATCC 62051]
MAGVWISWEGRVFSWGQVFFVVFQRGGGNTILFREFEFRVREGYITHAEHAGQFGAHSASVGHRQKAEAPHPGTITPFDCCALSFQPFTHPVAARNSMALGQQHNNQHPVTKEPLNPTDLITLHYSRKEAQHSHIVTIATTGNVFLAESIKGGRDLVSDVPFKKEDVITLQNPHGLPSASIPAAAPPKPATSVSTVPVKPKAAVPWNVSPYSSGLPGASLTSTSIDPQTSSSKLVWDEEELMFEDISNPLKGKGKEKDLAPKTCYNFLMLAKLGKFDNCLFHRLVPGFMIQTGDPTGTGAGGASYWETPFRDEHDLKGAARHDSRGTLAMANKGPGTNGSQWYLTFKATPNLDRKHTVFGKLVGGEDVLDALEKIPLKDGTERPAKPVRITEIIIYQDPFEEYKTRLAKKLARRAEAAQNNPADKASQKKEGDDINWFGVKVGSGDSAFGTTAGGGVGKYLNLKRTQEAVADSGGSDSKKKRKTGFGSFDNW